MKTFSLVIAKEPGAQEQGTITVTLDETALRLCPKVGTHELIRALYPLSDGGWMVLHARDATPEAK